MKSRNRISEKQVRQVLDLYKAGKPWEQIIASTGVGRTAVSRILKTSNTSKRLKRGDAVKKSKRGEKPSLSAEQLHKIKELSDRGASWAYMQEIVGITQYQLRKALAMLKTSKALNNGDSSEKWLVTVGAEMHQYKTVDEMTQTVVQHLAAGEKVQVWKRVAVKLSAVLDESGEE